MSRTMQRIAIIRFGRFVHVVLRRGAWAFVTLHLLTGCSQLNSRPKGDWLEHGSLALSRPMPLAQPSSDIASAVGSASPTLVASDAAQIVVSRSAKTITAMRPGHSPMSFKAEGAQHLPQGSFSVTIKEENPLWYAPEEYFTKRSLEIPNEGSRARFMRAALGNRALFLNDQTPIHSGPVWLNEIGGLRVKSSAMEQLYSMVTIGTRVEVR